VTAAALPETSAGATGVAVPVTDSTDVVGATVADGVAIGAADGGGDAASAAEGLPTAAAEGTFVPGGSNAGFIAGEDAPSAAAGELAGTTWVTGSGLCAPAITGIIAAIMPIKQNFGILPLGAFMGEPDIARPRRHLQLDATTERNFVNRAAYPIYPISPVL
jgi:hypothetical protein